MKYTVQSRKFDETTIYTVYEDGIAVADFTRRGEAEGYADECNRTVAG